MLGMGPRLMKKRIYRAAVSQRLRNTGIEDLRTVVFSVHEFLKIGADKFLTLLVG